MKILQVFLAFYAMCVEKKNPYDDACGLCSP